MNLDQITPIKTAVYFVDTLVTCYNCQNKFWTAIKTDKVKYVSRRILFCAECEAK
jgi:hypothetical protein